MKNPIMKTMARLVCAAAILSLLAWITAATQTPATLPADKIAKVEEAIKAVISRQHIPGLSIAIVTDHQLRWQQSYGLAEVENSIPAKTATVYRIASVTKPITAVAAMQLAERGKLDLDAPVQKYVPSFPTKQFPITTRQLLAHLSGVRHYKPGEGEYTDHYESLTEALSIFKDDPLKQEPGTQFIYTTFGYTLLGVVIERASGMTFPDYLREHVFKPAGMQHTYVDDIYALIPNRARGYSPQVYGQFDGAWRNPVLMDSSYKIPGGGLASTAEDLARFAIAAQSGVLIKQETFVQMAQNQKTREGRETGYGYGWYVDAKGAVWHGGVQPGATGTLYTLPKERFAVAILTNLEGGGRLGLEALANQIAEIVRQ